MILPKVDAVELAQEKLSEYLLSTTHREGRHKAAFFLGHGFSVDACQLLAAALRHHAEAHPLTKVEASPFGVRYIVEGIMKTPDGRIPKVRSVWFIDHGKDTPRFVTAYPLERGVP